MSDEHLCTRFEGKACSAQVMDTCGKRFEGMWNFKNNWSMLGQHQFTKLKTQLERAEVAHLWWARCQGRCQNAHHPNMEDGHQCWVNQPKKTTCGSFLKARTCGGLYVEEGVKPLIIPTWRKAIYAWSKEGVCSTEERVGNEDGRAPRLCVCVWGGGRACVCVGVCVCMRLRAHLCESACTCELVCSRVVAVCVNTLVLKKLHCLKH